MDLNRNQLIRLLAGVILIVFSVLAIFVPPLKITDDIAVSLHFVWLSIALGYMSASVRFYNPVQADQLGVRIVLGVATDDLEAGVPFAPPGIAVIETAPKSVSQREFPTEPEKIFRHKEGESPTPPPGMLPPLRIPFAEKPLTKKEARATFGELYALWPAEAIDRTAQTLVVFDHTPGNDGLATTRITAEIPHIARIRVESLRELIKNIPPHPDTGSRIDEVFRQIEDEQTLVITTVLTKLTVAQALRNLTWINAVMFLKVSRRLQAAVTYTSVTVDGNEINIPFSEGKSAAWGVNLEGSFLKGILFNHGLNAAIASVAESSFAAAATIRTAEGEKQRLIKEGEGRATAAKALVQETLEGRALGLEKMAGVVGMPGGAEAIASETARAFGEGDNATVLGTGGIEQAFGIMAAATRGLRPTKGGE